MRPDDDQMVGLPPGSNQPPKAKELTPQQARQKQRCISVLDVIRKFATQGSEATWLLEASTIVLAGALVTINDLPRAKRKSTKRAAAELRRLQKLATELRLHIAAMHRTALAAIKQHGHCQHPLMFTEELALLAWAAKRSSESVMTKPAEVVTGRERKGAAQMRTDEAAHTYSRITGRAPAGKDFSRFLAAIFEILEEKASVAGQLKALEKRLGK